MDLSLCFNMKKIILFLSLMLGFIGVASAQNCAPNNISTNPAAPVNNQRPSMTNTFDWTQMDYPLNIRHIYNGYGSIRSPFFDSDNSIISGLYDPIPGPKDYLPDEDGWELIKRDFGFEASGVEVNNPYFILYNKYRGLLRLFIARGDQAFFNGAMIKVQFAGLSPMQTSLLDHSGQLAAINSTFTQNPVLNSASEILNGYEEWFYADFPMNYDPCTCLYQSKVEIKIDLSNTSIISLSGTTNGEIVSSGKPTAAQKAKGSFSIGYAENVTKKIHQTYKGINDWATDLKGKGANVTSTDNLMNEAKKPKFLKAGLGSLSWISSALSLLDFFVSGGRKVPPGPQEVSVTPMSITMNSTYTGTFSTQYPYANISFRTPGSDHGNSPDTEYPYYNEVLGIFNLLYIPKVNYTHSVTRTPAGCKGCYINNYSSSYRLAENITYVLNPAAKLEVQEIKATIVIEGKNMGGTWNEGVNAITGVNQSRFSYADLGCLPTTTFNSAYSLPSTTISGPTTSFRRIYIKITANLRRLDATDDTQNILFVAIYPAEPILVSSIPATSACTTPLRQPESKASVQSYCASSAYTSSSRFRKGRNYEDLVSQLENDERQKIVNDFSNTVGLEIYPNPVQNNVTINYFVSENSLVKISVVNSIGQEIVSSVVMKESGNHQEILNLLGYERGVYLCVVNVNGKRLSKRLIIN